MSEPDYITLKTYNAEVERGLEHTPEWVAKMVALQAEFDAEYRSGVNGFGKKITKEGPC